MSRTNTSPKLPAGFSEPSLQKTVAVKEHQTRATQNQLADAPTGSAPVPEPVFPVEAETSVAESNSARGSPASSSQAKQKSTVWVGCLTGFFLFAPLILAAGASLVACRLDETAEPGSSR